MRNIHTLVVVLFFSMSAWANQVQTIQQLEKKISTAQNDTEKITTQNDLVLLHLSKGDIKKAEKLLLISDAIARNQTDQSLIASCLDIQGKIYESKFDYTNAYKVFLEALRIRENEDQKLDIGLSFNNLGRSLLKQGEIEPAIDQLKKALKVLETSTDHQATSETHQLLGDAYIAKNRSGSAKNHFKRSMDLKIKLQDFINASQLASKLGKIESNLGAYDSALTYYQMSLDMNSSIQDEANIAHDYENIAETYFAQDDIESAIESNSIALNIWTSKDDKIGQATVYKNLALCFLKQENTAKTKQYLEKAVQQLRAVNNAPETHQIYKTIARTYETLNDYKKAYQYHNAFAVTKDSFYSQEKSSAMLKLSTKYESEFEAEKKQQMISQLELEQTASKRVRSFLMALILMIGALAATLYYSYIQKKKANVELQERNNKIQLQKNEIDAKNVELEDKNARLDLLNGKLVSEMAERESIEQSSFARERFLATMSHEMRTPMNAIVGLTHLLIDEKPRANQIDHMRNLLFSANNLTVFINDILDFSKIEAGKLTLDSRPFEPKNIFDEIYFRFKTPVEEEGVSLNYHYDDRIPENLVGDPARLNQIINNLLSSSLQKTKKGAISLKVYLEELNPKNVMLKIVLMDTGIGLSEEELEKMFQNYWENSDDIYDGYERSRMALAIAKRLVDLQNGKLEVDTIEGKGTTYTIRIPCKQGQAARPFEAINTVESAKALQVAKENNRLDRKRILVVEDNKINQLVVAKLLRNLGAIVETVDHGADAVSIIEEQSFDLILMDIQMPIMDGYKATARIRSMKDPSKNMIPIIALTASAFLSETEKAKLFGMNDHVGKPFGPEDLLEKIHTCLHTASVNA